MGSSKSKTNPGTENELSTLRNDDERYGTAFEYESKFAGPVKNRNCTDVLCIFLFLAFLGGWGFVAYIAMTQGDINKVIYPTDSEGAICGYGPLKDFPYLMYFDLTRCLNPEVLIMGCPTKQICVVKCPDRAYSVLAAIHGGHSPEKIKGIMKPYCSPSISLSDWKTYGPLELLDKNLCPAWFLPSSPALGRCFPSLISNESNQTVINAIDTFNSQEVNEQTIYEAVSSLGAFLNLRNFGERIFNDILDTWWMIFIGLSSAVILSFLWIVLMRYLAGVMIWSSIGLILISIGSLLSYSTYRYIDAKDSSSAQGSILSVNLTPNYFNDVLGLSVTWLIFTIVLAIVFLIILLLLIALRQRIAIAIQLIEQGSKAVSQMRSTLFFPIFPFLLKILVVLWFTAVALLLSSAVVPEFRVFSSNKEPCICNSSSYVSEDLCEPQFFNSSCQNVNCSCVFVKYVKSHDSLWMIWYNLFGLYWSINFVAALSELILAFVFATWYWTRDKASVPFFTLGWSVYASLVFHLGTVAFGSLIIAIVQFLRTILSYVESKLKKWTSNEVTKCLLCACKCCLYLLEKFLKFINRNAYIMCAIKSTNFCLSAKNAFNLLMRNLVRVVVLDKVVDFLLFLGKLVIVIGIGAFSYFYFRGDIVQHEIPTLNYILTPIVIIVVSSYFISSTFFRVYSMAVDTLFLCFLEDLERNNGTPSRPYYMTPDLQKIIGKMNKFHANTTVMK